MSLEFEFSNFKDVVNFGKNVITDEVTGFGPISIITGLLFGVF